jgi:hypothetical protein
MTTPRTKRKTSRATITPPVLPAGGQRVGVVCGPCQWPKDRAGTVLCLADSRWGQYAVVLMDNGTTDTCHGLTKVGIGWYAL